MKDPHNYQKVGYSMIVVAGSLAAIALIGLAIGENVLFGDEIQRNQQTHFEDCKQIDFQRDDCEKFWGLINNDVSGIYINQGDSEAP